MIQTELLLAAAFIILGISIALRRAKKGGGCCGDREKKIMRVSVRDRNKKHYSISIAMDIGGMTCENCAIRVENALNQLDGIWATVRIDKNQALIRAKTHPDEVTLRRAVQQAGYVILQVRQTNE